MAKIVKNKSAIVSALIIDGIAFIRERTANLSPSFLEIMRNGLRTLSIRITLINGMFTLLNIIDITYKIYILNLTQNITIVKSIMFHEIFR
jgi:hypothetical protein